MNGEVQPGLLMTLWVLLTPKDAKELRPVILYVKGPSDFRMTGQAERQHLRWIAITRFPMVDSNRALSTVHCRASRHTASVIVAFQHFLTMTTEVFFILTLERVTGRT